MSEADARQAASELQRQYDAEPCEFDPWAERETVDGETVAAYAARWIADRRKRGLRSVRDDESRLAHWVLPTIGHKRMDAITRDDVERVRDALDSQVRLQGIAWKTAANIWGVCAKLFRDACGAKARALRVLTSNPCAGVMPTDRGRDRAKAYLYPTELLAFVGCEAVTLAYRRLVAVAVYSYLREGELGALEWSDVDLEHREINVHRALDGKTFETRAPKTAAGTRTVPIAPTLVPLLEAMGDEAGWTGRVFPVFPAQRDASAWLRAGLMAAGAKRAALHTRDVTRLPITFHDLRATGITWRAIRGDDVVKIQRNAGHEDIATTMRYVREAEVRRDGFGDVFPALPPSLGLATGLATGMRGHAVSTEKTSMPAAGVEPGGDVTLTDSSRLLQRIATPRRQRGASAAHHETGLATGCSRSIRGDTLTLDALELWSLSSP